jgi:hypothetical protein
MPFPIYLTFSCDVCRRSLPMPVSRPAATDGIFIAPDLFCIGPIKHPHPMAAMNWTTETPKLEVETD